MIKAVSKIIFFSICLLVSTKAFAISKTVYSITAGGSWTNGADWSSTSGGASCSCVPDESKDVIYVETNITSGAGITFGAQAILTVRNNSTLTINGNTVFMNGAQINVNAGSSLVINGNLDNQNNSNQIIINGSISVNGNFTGGNGSTVSGTGNMTTTGSVTTTGTGSVFSSTTQCNPGPCTASTGTGVLPVEMLYFQAVVQKSSVRINWATATETNNDYFNIERSSDGNTFQTIATADGSGNSSVQHSYEITDTEPLEGISYYRLKQVDYNGRFTYTGPVAVHFTGLNALSVYPSPSDGNFNVSISGEKGKEVTLTLRDVLGREFYSDILLPADDNSTLSIDLSGKLAPGVYVITAAADGRFLEKKLVIR